MTFRLVLTTFMSLGLLAASGLAQQSAPGNQPPKVSKFTRVLENQPGSSPRAALPPIDITTLADGEARPMEYLRHHAARIMSHVKSIGAQKYLIASNWAPMMDGTRQLYINPATLDAVSPAGYERLGLAERAQFREYIFDEGFYYNTFEGSPHSRARMLDLLCLATTADPKDKLNDCFSGRKILDLGCSGLVHLKLLASLGMTTIGVHDSSLIEALYSEPGDQGEVQGAYIGTGDEPMKLVTEPGPSGTTVLYRGNWPADKSMNAFVGEGYDYIISKNYLTKGRVHPADGVAPINPLDLKVSDEEFLANIHRILKPDGLFIIYNLAPGPTPSPAQDPSCPFSKEAIEKAGFEVLNYSTDDTAAFRPFADALEWNQPPMNMDLSKDFVANYTLIRRKAK